MTESTTQEPPRWPSEVAVRMEDVESHSIRRIGYNADKQQLVIQFYDSLPGLRTVYSGVPPEIHQGLLQARSMGQYLEENIRYTYDFALVDDDKLVDPE